MNKKTFLILLILLLAACSQSRSRRSAIEPTLTPEMLIFPPARTNPTPIPSDLTITLTAVVNKQKNSEIQIDGINPGQYGRTVITNAGTSNQLTYIGYFFPAGSYNVVNQRDFPDYLLIYSSATIWDNGVEYPANTKSYPFSGIGDSKIAEVPEGYYIKVIPPSVFTIYSPDLKENVSVSTPIPYHEPKNLIPPTAAVSYYSNYNSGYSSGCWIKGNINSSGDKIYHCPGWRDYSKTNIDESKGERWFCSESEARNAGWRDPDYAHGPCRN